MIGSSGQARSNKLDIDRQTVCNQRHKNVAFAVKFNTEQRAAWSTHRERLRSLVSKAVDVSADDILANLDPKLRQSQQCMCLFEECRWKSPSFEETEYLP